MKKIIYIILRVLFGLVFIFSGFVKAVDPMGFAYKMQDHLAVLGMEFFDPLTLPAAILLCAVEFVIGINFLLGVNMKLTSILALMFMGVMTPFTLYIAIVNPVIRGQYTYFP